MRKWEGNVRGMKIDRVITVNREGFNGFRLIHQTCE